MAKLVWRVKLIAELEPGVVSETEVARIANAGTVRNRTMRVGRHTRDDLTGKRFDVLH
jgi:hypothetical protein